MGFVSSAPSLQNTISTYQSTFGFPVLIKRDHVLVSRPRENSKQHLKELAVLGVWRETVGVWREGSSASLCCNASASSSPQ